MALSLNDSTKISLLGSIDDTDHRASWVGHLVGLGARVARYVREHPDRQLIVVISVPKRDYAAVLVGCGWVLASRPPTLIEPIDLLRTLAPGAPIRVVGVKHIWTGIFSRLDETKKPARVLFNGLEVMIDGVRAVAVLDSVEEMKSILRPTPGSMERMGGLDRDWDARLASPAADIAIVGTAIWIKEDLKAFLAKSGDQFPPSSVDSLLMPKVDGAVTWNMRLISSAGLADQLPLSEALNVAVLDGGGAIRYLGEIETPAVVCILDRSVPNESASELVLQLRNSRGVPLSLSKDLGWRPPSGVEGLAFTVAL